MNHADLSRRTEVEIVFDGADITNSIKPYQIGRASCRERVLLIV